MSKAVWGVDVGKSSVKAVKLEMHGTTPAALHMDVVPFPTSETGDASNLDQNIVDALTELKNNCRIGNDRVVLSLPGHSTFNRLIKLPPVDDAKIPEIVQYEAQSQIPFNIDEVIWDYQIIERPYGPGEEKEVILFAIKRDIVEQFLQNIAPVGLNIDSIQFAPVALYNYLSYDQDLGGAAIALDMGGDNTDLVIIDGPKFWIRNLPITGNDITKALQKAFNIPFGEAEKLKLKAAQSQQAQKIFNAIQPVLRDLVGEIHRSIGYYKSISKTAKFDKIILLGNSTKTLNFQKFVSQSLSTMGNLPAARLQKMGKVNADAIDQGVLNRHLATIGPAVGLALQGLGLASNRVNLLPPVFVKKKELKKKQPFIVAAVAALYVLVGLVWFTMSGEVDSLNTILANANAAQQKWNQLKSRHTEVTEQVKAPEADLATIASISSERDLVLDILNALNPCLPDNPKAQADGQLWIVDVRTEEVSAEDAPKDGTAISTGDKDARVYATKRKMKIVLEVVIVKRSTQEEGQKFIIDTILAPKEKTGLLKALSLNPEKKEGWDIVMNSDPIYAPLPKLITSDPSKYQPEEGAEMRFWRFDVSLTVLVGEKARADALAAPKDQPAKAPGQ